MGQAPVQKFLNGFNFSPRMPPNAAIEILERDEEDDVIYEIKNKKMETRHR